MSQRLSSKLQTIRSDLRRQQISSLMTKIRYEAIHQQTKQQLSKLIDIPMEMFTHQNLQLLLAYVQKDQTNAILHLGNLIIDRFITIDLLEGIQWKLGNNQYWTWLINAMTQLGYCNREMMEYLIWRVIAKKSSHNLQNALEALQRCLKNEQQFTLSFIQTRQQFLLALVNHVHDANQKIFQLSLSFIVSTTSISEELPRTILKVVGQARLTRCILQGLMKLNIQARNFAIQAANNFLMSDVILHLVTVRCVENAYLEKDTVKVQLSYFFRAVVKHYPYKELMNLVREYDLMGVLRYYSSENISHQKFGRQTRENAVIALKDLAQRLEHEDQTLGIRQICRWGLKEVMRDQGQTMCQEYNNRI